MGAGLEPEADRGDDQATMTTASAAAPTVVTVAGTAPVTQGRGPADLLRMQQTVGNAAIGRLLRSARRAAPAPARQLQRSPLPLPSSCGWNDSNDVLWHMNDRDDRVRNFLPTIDITTEDDLKWFLRRWFNATSCIEQAVATMQYFKNNTAIWPKAKQQYVDAIEIILIRAEEGLKQKRADLVTRFKDWIRPDALNDITTYTQLDRFERLNPGAGYASKYILQTMNPHAGAFVLAADQCLQTCPLAAAAMQKYLRTGVIDTIACKPNNEPAGYYVSPDPDTSWGPSRTWAATLKAMKGLLDAHGKFAVIEGRRTPAAQKQNNLTEFHYFIVLNIKGTVFAVDAFGGVVTSNVQAYVDSLLTSTYKFTTDPVTVTAADKRTVTYPSKALPN
jgi:hypothetical protein